MPMLKQELLKKSSEFTDVDKEIYAFIKSYILKHGYAPIYKEMAEALNRSTSTICLHVDKMIIGGIIETDTAGSPRALRLPDIKISERS